MIGTRVQQIARRMVERVMRPLAHLGITPNMLTLAGLLLTVLTASVIAFNHLRIGGLLVLFAGIFDMFDGAMARASQRISKFGAFFDSTLDRYSEGILLLGVIIYAQLHLPQQTTVVGTITTAQLVVWLAYVTALSSLMVSYTRARAEGLGLECKVGLLARPERVILLAIGLLIGQVALVWTMLVLAILTTVTAIQRIIHIWAITRPQKTQPAADDAQANIATSPTTQGSTTNPKPLRGIARRMKRQQPIES
jgi:CDP-diacylglycerol--glycerol-3-phosphate 3-phosphatidyltransferase